MHQKHSPRADFYRHLSFAAVGGFFGGYAILARCGVLASAQTMNLLEMVMDALHGKGGSALLHLLCLVIYFAGTMSTVLLPHLFHVDMRRLCPAVDALAAVAVGFFPENMPVIAALYPIFFAMSVQWSTFAGARGFNSSTIFSTNNTSRPPWPWPTSCVRGSGRIWARRGSMPPPCCASTWGPRRRFSP